MELDRNEAEALHRYFKLEAEREEIVKLNQYFLLQNRLGFLFLILINTFGLTMIAGFLLSLPLMSLYLSILFYVPIFIFEVLSIVNLDRRNAYISHLLYQQKLKDKEEEMSKTNNLQVDQPSLGGVA